MFLLPYKIKQSQGQDIDSSRRTTIAPAISSTNMGWSVVFFFFLEKEAWLHFIDIISSQSVWRVQIFICTHSLLKLQIFCSLLFVVDLYTFIVDYRKLYAIYHSEIYYRKIRTSKIHCKSWRFGTCMWTIKYYVCREKRDTWYFIFLLYIFLSLCLSSFFLILYRHFFMQKSCRDRRRCPWCRTRRRLAAVSGAIALPRQARHGAARSPLSARWPCGTTFPLTWTHSSRPTGDSTGSSPGTRTSSSSTSATRSTSSRRPTISGVKVSWGVQQHHLDNYNLSTFSFRLLVIWRTYIQFHTILCFKTYFCLFKKFCVEKNEREIL